MSKLYKTTIAGDRRNRLPEPARRLWRRLGTGSDTESGAVSGTVTVEDSGKPYAGATVEFRNVYGKDFTP